MNSLRALVRFSFALMVLLAAAPALLHGATLVSLGSSSNCGSLTGGQVCTLTARVTGATDLHVTFTFSPTVSGAIIGTPVGPDSSGGTTITYTAPNVVSARVTIVVTAKAIDGTVAQAQISLAPPTVTVLVSPSTVTLTAGQAQQFTANVLGISSPGVTWSLSSAVGTIDANGLYTAPGAIATTQKISAIATSTFDGTTTGAASITLQAPATITVTVAPATVSLTAGQSQTFTATVANSTATPSWSISPQVGSIDQSGNYTAPSSVTTTQKVTVTATAAGVSGTASITLSVLIDVGTGAPNATLQAQFIQAFYRGNFSSLVSLPPQGQVASLGGGVYGQKFSDAAKTSGVTYALVTASPTVNPAPDGTTFPIAQILPGMFAYYSTVGATTAGFPVSDTLTCPFFDPNNTCTYQRFDKNYLLVVYANALTSGVTTVSVSSTFLTTWDSLGGFGGPGLPTAASAALTAGTPTTSTAQTFTSGEIFSVTSGVNKGLIFGVIEPIYDLYLANGGPAGSLGLPTQNAIKLTSGVTQQQFEGGLLLYDPANGGSVQVPVGSVTLAGLPSGGSFTLALGQTMTLSASVYSTTGAPITNRLISWFSSSSNVASVQANGATAVVTAAGGGTATVQASAGGISSVRVTFLVTVPCCQIGDGAPLAVQGEFRTALSRNQINIAGQIPDPATRTANGYVQTVQSAAADGSVTTYLLTAADNASAAYVVTGLLLAAYQSMGGPGGVLGYPLSDASAGGTQLFANGALSGSPLHLVNGLILTKWKAMGYETGAAGAPTGDPTPFSTIGANSGNAQNFARGTIYAAIAGPRAGQVYFVSGLILAAFTGAGGAAGNMGMPVTDETVSGNVHTQSFEGGSISYSVGDSVAQVKVAPKSPAVLVAPAVVSAGGHAVFAITGFANNSTVRVSMSGQPDFLVTTTNGAYTWDTYVPLSSQGGTVAIHAADTRSSSSADGTLTVRSLAASKATLAMVQGNQQSGLPGAMLPLPLGVLVADSTGAPVIGVTVTFQASTGAQLSATSVVTDTTGHAQTYVRLPASTGVALVNASAPAIGASQVTFGVVAAASSLPGFPNLQQSGSALLGHGTATVAQKGALLTAVASILQYHQNHGELPLPNGLADPGTLNKYLTSLCSVDAGGKPVCDGFLSNGSAGEQIVNLWRAAQFTGSVDVSVVNPSVAVVADLVAQGEPVLLSLALTRGGAPAGGHFVVATGAAADGSLVIQDPNPLFSRTSLADYLNGFAAGGATWQGALLGAVRFAVRGPSPTSFVAGALSQPASLISKMALNVISSAGACGAPVAMQDTVDASGNSPAGVGVSLLSVCNGTQSAYQIDVGTSQPYSAFLTDLAIGGSTFDLSGSAAASYVLTRPKSVLVLSPLIAGFDANSVVNAATFTSGLAPGGIMAIFGSGLSGAGTGTVVDVDGTSAAILFSSPFQVNAQVPPTVTPGVHTIRVKSANGTAQQQVTVSPVAPVIFLLGSPSVGAILNQDNSINSAMTPLPRGQVLQIYATGLGVTVKQGQYDVAVTPVTAVVNGVEVPALFAGLSPGFVGLNQVNVAIPTTMAPGSGISLTLKQGGQLSNTVLIALQ